MVAYRLAASYNLDPMQVMEARNIFDSYDTDQQGALDDQEFQSMLWSVLKERYPDIQDVPEDLFCRVDESRDGQVDFEEFLQWITTQSFREELLLPVEQQWIRQVARTFEMPIPEVEAVKRTFDHFDSDKSGSIDYAEFMMILSQLLRTPKHTELPANRVHAFWREIDTDGSGTVDFEEFLPWYLRYFPIDGSVNSSVTPVESFYAAVRGNAHGSGLVMNRESFSEKHSHPGRPHTSPGDSRSSLARRPTLGL